MKSEYTANLELQETKQESDSLATRDNKVVDIFKNRGKVEEEQIEFNFTLEDK